MSSKLIVSEGGRDRVHEICEDTVVVGRNAGVDLHLRDPGASGQHCEIHRLAHGFKLVDLETASGTMVNGKPVNQHFLRNGDTIVIGQARITYLGESASGSATPPRPQPLTNLPLDREGRPRRFYRHETTSRSVPLAARLAIIGAALGLIGLLILALARSQYGEEAAKTFATASTLARKGDEASLREALRLFRSIPRGEFDERRLTDAVDEAERDLHVLLQVRQEQEEEVFYATTVNYFLSHPEDGGYLRGRIKVFEERWPQSPRLDDLKTRLRKVELGGPEKERAWEAAQEALSLAIRSQDYKEAFRILKQNEDDPALGTIFASTLANHRTILERDFESYYKRMYEAALDAKAKGDPEAAVRILSTLAEVGLEPFSSEARRSLEKLR